MTSCFCCQVLGFHVCNSNASITSVLHSLLSPSNDGDHPSNLQNQDALSLISLVFNCFYITLTLVISLVLQTTQINTEVSSLLGMQAIAVVTICSSWRLVELLYDMLRLSNEPKARCHSEGQPHAYRPVSLLVQLTDGVDGCMLLHLQNTFV